MKGENAGTPAVSIIIPVYNAENFLARCVDSVLGQEYTDFELLLIDDGSKDKSGAMCDAYAASDSRVRVFHKENAGVSAARNQALSEARGTYIQFLDSDDWMTPDSTKLLVRAAEENDCDLVIADFYRVVGERVSILQHRAPVSAVFQSRDGLSRNVLRKRKYRCCEFLRGRNENGLGAGRCADPKRRKGKSRFIDYRFRNERRGFGRFFSGGV